MPRRLVVWESRQFASQTKFSSWACPFASALLDYRDAVAKTVDPNQLARMDAQTLNVGLDMAMEFGQNWLKPIQERLHARYPQLSESELDEYDGQCQAAMKFGHLELRGCWRASNKKKDAAFQLFRQRVLAVYPWVSADNLNRLFSQGCYYAHKDGEL